MKHTIKSRDKSPHAVNRRFVALPGRGIALQPDRGLYIVKNAHSNLVALLQGIDTVPWPGTQIGMIQLVEIAQQRLRKFLYILANLGVRSNYRAFFRISDFPDLLVL